MTSSTERKSNGVCELDANLNLLRSLPLFQEVPIDTLRALAYLCKRMRYKEGEILFGQGDEDDKAYYIMEGEADLLHNTGDREHHVGGYGAGDFVGGFSLLADAHRLFTLKAKTPMQCIVLSRRRMPSDPEKASAFLTAYARAITLSVVDWEKHILDQAQASGHEDDILKTLRLGVSLL